MDWSDRVEQIKGLLSDDIVSVLEEIRKYLSSNGFHVNKPRLLDGDTYQWDMIAHWKPVPIESIDKVSAPCWQFLLSIEESMEHEGTEDGVNVSMIVTDEDGQELLHLEPYNYTDKVWVPLDSATNIIYIRLDAIKRATMDFLLKEVPSIAKERMPDSLVRFFEVAAILQEFSVRITELKIQPKNNSNSDGTPEFCREVRLEAHLFPELTHQEKKTFFQSGFVGGSVDVPTNATFVVCDLTLS